MLFVVLLLFGIVCWLIFSEYYIWFVPEADVIPILMKQRTLVQQPYRHDKWGDPNHDGPSPSMPNECYWFGGKLICSGGGRSKFKELSA